MLDAMRKKAASLGANGVILSGVQNPSAGAEVADVFLGTRSPKRRGEAVAVSVSADSLKSLEVCREFERPFMNGQVGDGRRTR